MKNLENQLTDCRMAIDNLTKWIKRDDFASFESIIENLYKVYCIGSVKYQTFISSLIQNNFADFEFNLLKKLNSFFSAKAELTPESKLDFQLTSVNLLNLLAEGNFNAFSLEFNDFTDKHKQVKIYAYEFLPVFITHLGNLCRKELKVEKSLPNVVSHPSSKMYSSIQAVA